MTLLDEVKLGQFLAATRDLSRVFEAGSWSLASGVQCALTHRGALQIIPPQLAPNAKDIVLSSGVHGNETAPIELIQALAYEILSGALIPAHRLLLIIAHPEAISDGFSCYQNSRSARRHLHRPPSTPPRRRS